MEASIIEQLKSVFASIQTQVVLSQFQSTHEKQNELKQMLEQTASTSQFIQYELSQSTEDRLGFELKVNDEPQGITFEGIPGGHEFTSFILAILYSVGQGKQADERTIQRIQDIISPGHLEVYVSLDCQNCPDVVQASHYIASLNPHIQATMIDGAIQPQLAEERGVLSVPTVFYNGEKIHTGRGSLGDILDKVIQVSEVKESRQTLPEKLYDVAIVGAGPAGASAAIYSARKGLAVALIADRVGGQVLETKSIENLISTPYTEGPELSANLDKHINDYKIDKILNQRVQKVENSEHLEKKLLLNSGDVIHTKSIIVASGAQWRKLGVPGEVEYTGSGVAYCPHCDGPLFRGKPVAVVGGGNSGVEAAIDLAGTSSHVTLFEFADELKADAVLVSKLESLDNVDIVRSAAVSQVLGDGSQVIGLKYLNRLTQETLEVELEGVFVQIGLAPNSGFLQDVVELSTQGEVVIDTHCKTSVPGIFAAGDVSTVPFKQIVIAMGEGAKASLSSFDYLIRHSDSTQVA